MKTKAPDSTRIKVIYIIYKPHCCFEGRQRWLMFPQTKKGWGQYFISNLRRFVVLKLEAFHIVFYLFLFSACVCSQNVSSGQRRRLPPHLNINHLYLSSPSKKAGPHFWEDGGGERSATFWSFQESTRSRYWFWAALNQEPFNSVRLNSIQ